MHSYTTFESSSGKKNNFVVTPFSTERYRNTSRYLSSLFTQYQVDTCGDFGNFLNSRNNYIF